MGRIIVPEEAKGKRNTIVIRKSGEGKVHVCVQPLIMRKKSKKENKG